MAPHSTARPGTALIGKGNAPLVYTVHSTATAQLCPAEPRSGKEMPGHALHSKGIE